MISKIIAKNSDNLLEAPTETKDICLERNGILLGKFKMDSEKFSQGLASSREP